MPQKIKSLTEDSSKHQQLYGTIAAYKFGGYGIMGIITSSEEYIRNSSRIFEENNKILKKFEEKPKYYYVEEMEPLKDISMENFLLPKGNKKNNKNNEDLDIVGYAD